LKSKIVELVSGKAQGTVTAKEPSVKNES